MTPPDPVCRQFCLSLDRSRGGTRPYRHWLLDEVLPPDGCRGIEALPLAPPAILETYGKRETNNASRTYFSPEFRSRHPVTDTVATAFQSPQAVAAIERVCGAVLCGSFLRLEYCQDTDGFWLEPHTDIGVKRFTMLVYLSSGPGSEAWGTDLLDGPDRLVATIPCLYNTALIFLPASDTWHGFTKRPISGVRKTIIVNYVGPEWRSRHELAFPEAPVGSG